MKTNMVLIKYKGMKILVSENAPSDLFTMNRDKIYALHLAWLQFVGNLLNTTDEDVARIESMKDGLSEFIEKSHVIGAPFDNHDAELFALDRKINYTILELS